MKPVGLLVESLPNHFHEDTERAVLFLLLTVPDLVKSDGDKVMRDDFLKYGHKMVFDVITALSKRDAPLDLPVIVAEAKTLGKPEVTDELVSGLTIMPEGEPTAANLPTLIAKLRAASIKRTAQFGLVQSLAVAKDERTSTEQLTHCLESNLTQIRNMQTDEREATPMTGLLTGLCDELESRMANPTGILGVPTGFDKLDSTTGGFRPGELVIVSGWTGRGKSTLVMQMAIHAARMGIPAIIYSLEMSDVGIADRIAAMVSGIDHYKIRQGRLTREERAKLLTSFGDYYELPFWHDFVGGMTARQVCARAHVDRLMKKVGIVFVDHIGKLASDPGVRYGSREQEVSAMSGEFDRLADELQVPVVLVSQMNRPFTPTGDVDEPMPSIHKIRDSGRLEADSDVVLFTHRPGIKQAQEARTVTGNYDLMEKAFILVGKCRSGESEVMLPVVFDGKHSRFLSLDNLPAGATVYESGKGKP